MLSLLRQINEMAGRHVGLLVLAGLAGVAWHTWWLWQRDKRRLTRKASPALPSSLGLWPGMPKVSALVAAWNEAEHIESHIRSFLDLRYPNKELVLCAGGSDGTYALACRLADPQVAMLEQRPGEGKQGALQRCLSRSDGAIIFLTDADCVFSEEAFLRLIEPIARGKAQVVTGVSEPKAHQRLSPLVQYQWFNDLVWSYQMPPTVDGVLGRNCALLREVLEAIGAFDAPVRTGTDYFLSRLLVRAGYAIQAVPDSRIATDCPDSPQGYVRMWRRWNKNLLIHGLRFEVWKDVKGVLIAFTLYSLILLLPLLTPILGPMAWGISLLLFSVANANRLRRVTAGAELAGLKVSWKWLVRLPYYTCLDMLAVLLALRDSVDPKLRSQW